MAKNHGTHVGTNRYAMIVWEDNVPYLHIYSVETNFVIDDETGEVASRGYQRNCKVSIPVDDQCYLEYDLEVLNSLPHYQLGLDLPEDFYMEVF
jgi:hypothetical protein